MVKRGICENLLAILLELMKSIHVACAKIFVFFSPFLQWHVFSVVQYKIIRVNETCVFVT